MIFLHEEEEPKKAAAPAKDAKGKKGDPKATAATDDDVKPPDEGEIQATDEELDAIKHVYVHMLL